MQHLYKWVVAIAPLQETLDNIELAADPEEVLEMSAHLLDIPEKDGKLYHSPGKAHQFQYLNNVIKGT